MWRLNSNGDVLTEKTLNIEGMGQVAKIRKDATSGFVLCSTAYGVLGGVDRNVVAVVKLDNSLNVEWSQVRLVTLHPDDICNNPLSSVSDIILISSDLRPRRRREPGVRHAGGQ